MFQPEDTMLWVATGATLAALVLLGRRLWDSRHATDALPRLLAILTASLGLAVATMLYYFLVVNLDIEYVFSYTSLSTPWPYRVAGLWGGQKGTILLWAAFSAAIVGANHALWRRNFRKDPLGTVEAARVLDWTTFVGLVVLLAFEFVLLTGGTFERADPYLRGLRPDGTGLQPVLRTPFMIIHPPLQFLAYAAATLLFSAGFAGVLTNRREWADFALPWTRFGFLISTIGLGLGGLWAYYVLNFGGYWAWDPVETANLIAWFPLLLLIHSLLYYRKRRLFNASAPVFALLTLPAVLFSTIATRTGLWVSVHAFTDPTRNFEADPLRRLLNILGTNVILEGLTAMFLASVLAGLLVHLKRYADERRLLLGRASPGILACETAVGVLAALAVLGFLNARFALSAVFQFADLIALGHAEYGLALLGLAMTFAYAAPGLAAPEPPARERKSFWDTYITTPQLVFVGVMLLGLAYLVTFLLQILSVNGYERSIYDERAPLVALPILLVLPAALAHPFVGKRIAVATSVGAGLLGIALAAIDRVHWHVWLVLPALAWALVGSAIKLYKVSDLGPTNDARLRIAGAILLFGGILTMLYWGNPPSVIALGPWRIQVSAWWAPIGYALGAVATFSAIGTLRRKTVRAHRVGAVALAAGFLGGFGLFLGAIALGLAESRKRLFPDLAKPAPMRSCAGDLRREIRKTGVYLIHVSLVLGLAGYAFSTYLQSSEQGLTLARGGTGTLHGYEFTFVDSEGKDFDRTQGVYREVSAIVQIRRNGADLGEVPLTMWLAVPRQYAERVDVERYAVEDLYLRPVAFVTPEVSFQARENDVALISGRVDEVTFTAKTLPGMHLVWGGLWTIGFGVIVVLASGGWEFALSRPKADAE